MKARTAKLDLQEPSLPASNGALPAQARGRAALGLSAYAARGQLRLQVCAECQTVQYPPRYACVQCLSTALTWREVSGRGQLIARTELRHSNNEYFRSRLPWPLGLVQLDCGPTVIAHLRADVAAAPASVRIEARLDRAGMGVLVAHPLKETETMSEQTLMQEWSNAPQHRHILVSDGSSTLGLALVQHLLQAGAKHIWVGQSTEATGNCWNQWAQLPQAQQVSIVTLDLREAQSVQQCAADLGQQLDIVINNHQCLLAPRAATQSSLAAAHQEMQSNYFGLLHLAQAFGPALKARASLGHACAWVNLLSICALSHFPAQSTFSASIGAAHALSLCLRAELQAAGIRVVNVFAGPLDEAQQRHISPPKMAPKALASAIVQALKLGIEDVYPGDVAQEWLQRFDQSPKVLERELNSVQP